jgi:glutathione S-transferase
MKLYYSPGACSIGIHVILEEIGAPFDLELVNLREGAQFGTEFTAVNPKSKVPTLLRDDATVLTEFPAIAYWLAATHPEAKLWPADAERQSRALEAMEYVTATVHMQGYTRINRPARFTPTAADEERVKEQGAEMVQKGLHILERSLGDKQWVAGDYSVADAALFYVELWADQRGRSLPANEAAHLARMKERPAVQRVLRKEGFIH